MALPDPHPGVARQVAADRVLATVVPVTHTPPADSQAAIEIPSQIKARLNLDEQSSWIVVSEVNVFVWPGPDLRHVAGSQPPRFDYGVLPPGFFREVRGQLLALHAARRVQPIPARNRERSRQPSQEGDIDGPGTARQRHRQPQGGAGRGLRQ